MTRYSRPLGKFFDEAAISASTASAAASAFEPGRWNTAMMTVGSPERSEEHTSELQSLMRISYAVFCLKKNSTARTHWHTPNQLLIRITTLAPLIYTR